MSLIIAQNLNKDFGGESVLENVSVQVGEGQHIGLIGPNGAGKSTLLNILTGNEEASSGTTQIVGNAKIGYVTQESQLDSNRILYEELKSVFSNLLELQNSMQDLEPELSSGKDDVIRRYDELHHAFETGGGYSYESRIHSVLNGLKFSQEDAQQPVSHLSGGQAGRAALAKLLLEEPDVLLLDEPTNHLDVDSVEWLEDYLSRWKKAYIISSHDRHLLDRLVDKIWAINHKKLKLYTGNYSDYVPQREEELKHQLEAYYEQQAWLKKSEDFVQKNIYDKKTTNLAKSRRKMIEKTETLEKPEKEKQISFEIQFPRESGKRIFRLQDIDIGYPATADARETKLFNASHAIMDRNERIALIGPNGSGKTTLLKTLVQQLSTLRGEVEWGHAVEPAYFAQTAWGYFDRDMTLVDSLIDQDGWTISKARELLAKFLFRGDDVFKKLGMLSGGERSRVALARLSQLGGNFLLLDEPTNHLDIPSRETLEEVLIKFPGSILFVSHDRYFIQTIATQIWEVKEEQLHVYKGDYAFYLRKKDQPSQTKSALESSGKKPQEETKKKLSPGKLKRIKDRERGKLERQEVELSTQMNTLEEQITLLEKEMEQASYNQDLEKVQTLSKQYEQAKAEQTSLLEQWEAAMAELEAFELNPSINE